MNNIEDLLKEIKTISPTFTKYLHTRLEEWGDCYSEKDKINLDFHPENLIHSMMKLGCLPATKGKSPSPVNEQADEIEVIVRMMAINGETQSYANAIREYYLMNGERTQEKAARYMGTSLANFRIYFKGAFKWLEGWFTCKYVHGVFGIKANNSVTASILSEMIPTLERGVSKATLKSQRAIILKN